MERVVIARALRTPIGKFVGGLSKLTAADLGVAVVQPLVEGIDVRVDELAFGCARQAGQRTNPARQIAVRAGLGEETFAVTVNSACGSGLTSMIYGAHLIQLGRARTVVAGGVESMSRVPFMLDRMRTGYRLGHARLVDGMYQDGFHCPLADQLMGRTAETLAERYGITREEQDAYALRSQQRAARAIAEGAFANEIVPVTTPDGVVDTDEHVRGDTTLEKLARLPPVFRENGTVHAGNSSGITDAAAALLLMAESDAAARGLEPLAVFEDHAAAGVDPAIMGIAPVPATRNLLTRLGAALDDFGLVELNEAFAAQVLACDRELRFDHERLNVHGGAIALGHPIGCTAARIVVTLLHAMRRHGAQRGLATLCISGGMGMAASFRAP